MLWNGWMRRNRALFNHCVRLCMQLEYMTCVTVRVRLSTVVLCMLFESTREGPTHRSCLPFGAVRGKSALRQPTCSPLTTRHVNYQRDSNESQRERCHCPTRLARPSIGRPRRFQGYHVSSCAVSLQHHHAPRTMATMATKKKPPQSTLTRLFD